MNNKNLAISIGLIAGTLAAIAYLKGSGAKSTGFMPCAPCGRRQIQNNNELRNQQIVNANENARNAAVGFLAKQLNVSPEANYQYESVSGSGLTDSMNARFASVLLGKDQGNTYEMVDPVTGQTH